MSGKTVLVLVLIPLALAVPVILVKLVVKDTDRLVPVELLGHYEAAPVTHYDVRLDEKASPRDVVYVLLKSVRELYTVAETSTRTEQVEGVRRAQEIQLSLAAPKGIVRAYVENGLAIKTEGDKQRLVLRSVLAWGRTVGYYVDDMKLDDRGSWKESIDTSNPSGPQAIVLVPAKKGDFLATVAVYLTKEANLWRIVKVTLAPSMTKLSRRPILTTLPVPTTKAAPPAKPAPAPKAAPASKPATKPAPKPPTPVAKPKPAPAASAPAKAPAKPAPAAPPSKPASKPTTTGTAK